MTIRIDESADPPPVFLSNGKYFRCALLKNTGKEGIRIAHR